MTWRYRVVNVHTGAILRDNVPSGGMHKGKASLSEAMEHVALMNIVGQSLNNGNIRYELIVPEGPYQTEFTLE